mmetsp:Transcript_2006/g.4302  ORF Transcript_2006/g.4302 Transcript_2006/m.4302 type:complete len:90 (-) Transcript_2006:502-771(-)
MYCRLDNGKNNSNGPLSLAPDRERVCTAIGWNSDIHCRVEWCSIHCRGLKTWECGDPESPGLQHQILRKPKRFPATPNEESDEDGTTRN